MQQSLSSSQEAIMAALCYGHIYSFPLKLEEFGTYMPFLKTSLETLRQELNDLTQSGRVIRQGDYFSLSGERDHVLEREGKSIDLEHKWSMVREKLPLLLGHSWIKGALLTGSLAAKNPDGQADADLMLILDKRRIWIGYLWVRLWCRFRKSGLFCPNYVLADNQLELSFPNYFTSVEYAISVPLKWTSLWPAMEAANPWFREFLPNSKEFSQRREEIGVKRSWLTWLVDLVIQSPLGWLLNKLEWWRLRFKTKGLYSPTPWVYKPHPPKRQWIVFKQLLKSLNQFEIVFPKLRNHIQSELQFLEKAEEPWPVQKENQKKTQSECGVRKVCSRNAN